MQIDIQISTIFSRAIDMYDPLFFWNYRENIGDQLNLINLSKRV